MHIQQVAGDMSLSLWKKAKPNSIAVSFQHAHTTHGLSFRSTIHAHNTRSFLLFYYTRPLCTNPPNNYNSNDLPSTLALSPPPTSLCYCYTLLRTLLQCLCPCCLSTRTRMRVFGGYRTNKPSYFSTCYPIPSFLQCYEEA